VVIKIIYDLVADCQKERFYKRYRVYLFSIRVFSMILINKSKLSHIFRSEKESFEKQFGPTSGYPQIDQKFRVAEPQNAP
jgi:hypothetical protein